MGLQEIVAAVVGLVLLLLRVFRVDQRLSERAELRLGEGRRLSSGGCHRVLERAGEELRLEGVLGMAFEHMAYLVADDSHQFVVVHYVHQRREHAHASVGACECVDVYHVVYLEVQRYPVSVLDAFGELVETDRVGVVVRKHGVVLVHPVYRLFDVCSHLLVCQCHGLHGFGGPAYGFLEVELRRCGYRCQGADHCDE